MIIKKFMSLCRYLYITMPYHYALFHITLTLKFETMHYLQRHEIFFIIVPCILITLKFLFFKPTNAPFIKHIKC